MGRLVDKNSIKSYEDIYSKYFFGPVRLSLVERITVVAGVLTPDIWINLIIKVFQTTRNQNRSIGTCRHFHSRTFFSVRAGSCSPTLREAGHSFKIQLLF
jgi:hypothetical protein